MRTVTGFTFALAFARSRFCASVLLPHDLTCGLAFDRFGIVPTVYLLDRAEALADRLDEYFPWSHSPVPCPSPRAFPLHRLNRSGVSPRGGWESAS